MAGIPPALDDDTEDVAWALQTADALWRRNEQVDAIVWLRRAAQSADDAHQHDRALTLSRSATELAGSIANSLAAGRVAWPTPGGPQSVEASAAPGPTAQDAAAGSIPPASRPRVPTGAELHAGMLDPWAEADPTGRASAAASQAFEAEDLLTSASRLSAAGADGQVPDLSDVEALGDLPDDVRDRLAADAAVQTLERGDESTGFGLALILTGAMDVSAASVDVPVLRLAAGEVLRSRGTVKPASAVRLTACAEQIRLATWSEEQIADALACCPWVEDDLRSAADLAHARAGATLGCLGERIDPSMRGEILRRLDLRVLTEREVLVEAGQPVVGLFIVGAGGLDLSAAGGAVARTLGPGDVLFPAEVLRAASAPATARASADGALVLYCERSVSQELLVTYPPLLELLAESS